MACVSDYEKRAKKRIRKSDQNFPAKLMETKQNELHISYQWNQTENTICSICLQQNWILQKTIFKFVSF